jgi:exopolyphosphatase / guanosine-5'-triphosphate,3'-diphosphate pyrophosphatase
VTRVAAIDCGTNSIRLLIADVDGGVDGGKLVDVVRTLRIVRLGRGVDRTGRLDPAAIERTRVALAGYAAEVARLGVARTRMVATSATRDAANRADFHDMVRDTLGAPAEVISGDEEAALSFAGAVRGLDAGEAPYLVVDIGGGSTEFVLGDAAGMWSGRSVDIGCVRLTERHLRDDPPSPEQIAAAEADVRAALGLVRERVRVDQARSFVGLAGSVTTVAALALGLTDYDAARIHGSRIAADDVRAVADRLLAADQATRAANPVIHPGRVDVIGGGALVLRVLVDELAVPEVVVSEHDILDGIAWSLARR